MLLPVGHGVNAKIKDLASNPTLYTDNLCLTPLRQMVQLARGQRFRVRVCVFPPNTTERVLRFKNE